MTLEYDITQYLASVKMSSKKRVLVEGRDDKSHMTNLIAALTDSPKVKVDTAEMIKGECSRTAKNNRAKLEVIHARSKGLREYSNLLFLCDREFYKFLLDQPSIEDLMEAHEVDGNLSWTRGHSLENYFLLSDVVNDAFRYLCSSEYKTKALDLLIQNYPSVVNIAASSTLAAREINKQSFPAGLIQWRDISITTDGPALNFESILQRQADACTIEFINAYNSYAEKVQSSNRTTCIRVCRGHTAVILIQRTFAAYLYSSISPHSKVEAQRHAESFASTAEARVSAALCEAWIRLAKQGIAEFPAPLIASVA
jgi:hypothetical protein